MHSSNHSKSPMRKTVTDWKCFVPSIFFVADFILKCIALSLVSSFIFINSFDLIEFDYQIGEKPYKVVKARPKWDRLSKKMVTDIPLELYGDWQVKARLHTPTLNRLCTIFIPSIWTV